MLYILTGLPYSGKTTLTKELVKRFGFSRVSMDEIINNKGFEIEKMTQEDWNTVYSLGYDRLNNFLAEGKTVVLDLGNLKRSERNTARKIADNLGIKYKIIYLNIPVGVIKDRWAKNENTKERSQLESVTLERALAMFELPTDDENYIVYNQDMDLDKWIKENIVSYE